MKHHFSIVLTVTLLFSAPAAFAQGCHFSEHEAKFAGSPAEQARCLLRRVLPGGTVAQTPAVLSPFFQANLGNPVGLTKGQLSNYLQKLNVSDNEIGGQIGKGVSESRSGTRALFFVIHDTSDDISGSSFPSVINDASYGLNRLDRRDISMAHVMISRAGDSRTGHSYSGELTATKFERIHDNADGLFLHHEMVQPRILGGYSFHAVGPNGGFSNPQMRRLALLYVVASVRRGTWMIPAFHAALDEGIPNGHDDPQNFDLALWQQMVEQVNAEASGTAVAKPLPPVQQPQQKPVQQPQQKPVQKPQPKPVQPTEVSPEQPENRNPELPPLPGLQPEEPVVQPKPVEPKKPVAKPVEKPVAKPVEKPVAKPVEKPAAKPKQPTNQCLWYAVASCDHSKEALAADQEALGDDFKIVRTDSISGFARGWYCLVSASEDRESAAAKVRTAKEQVDSSYVKKGGCGAN